MDARTHVEKVASVAISFLDRWYKSQIHDPYWQEHIDFFRGKGFMLSNKLVMTTIRMYIDRMILQGKFQNMLVFTVTDPTPLEYTWPPLEIPNGDSRRAVYEYIEDGLAQLLNVVTAQDMVCNSRSLLTSISRHMHNP